MPSLLWKSGHRPSSPAFKISNLPIRRHTRRAVLPEPLVQVDPDQNHHQQPPRSSPDSEYDATYSPMSSNSTLPTAATSFESLKRDAAHLERQLEEKVSRYQQLTQKWNAASIPGSTQQSHLRDDYHPLSRAEQGLQEADVLSLQQQEIPMLFHQLQDLVYNKLAQAAQTPSQKAVSQRYREILQDLKADFDKSTQMLNRARERKELLAGSADAAANGGSNDPAMDSLLRERNHIHNSINSAHAVIGQAEAVRQDLRGQGRSLRQVGSLMNQLTSNIPGLNQVMDQIRRRRSRDDKIVAGVMATCIVFTLWYLFG